MIEGQDPKLFHEYLKRTDNTICGRNPILVFLHALQHARAAAALEDGSGDGPASRAAAGGTFRLQWVKYDQSSHCESSKDSSVSYASCVILPVASAT